MKTLVELKPNIYQIRGEKPGSHVYLLRGRTKNILIDAGMADHFETLKSALAELALTPRDIHLIILTHEHFDHIGAAIFFAGTATIAAHRLAANKITVQDEFVMMNKLFDLSADPMRADIWLERDTIIDLGNFQLQVLHTPGHCSGCICIYEPHNRILFTGDTVLAGGVLSGIFPSGSISDYMHSLEQLSTLQIRYLYPGHGRISDQPKKDLRRAISDSERLLEGAKMLFGALDAKETFRHFFKAVRKFPFPSSNPEIKTEDDKAEVSTATH